MLETRYISQKICQKQYQELFNTYADVEGSKGIIGEGTNTMKMGDINFQKHTMICTSKCVSDDVKKCKDEGLLVQRGLCIGDSGG